LRGAQPRRYISGRHDTQIATHKSKVMTMRASSLPRGAACAILLALLMAVGAAGAASAQSCQEDFQKLSQRRMAAVAALNNLGKAGKGKMDPMAACPLARRLVGAEAEMLNYLNKNKEWCAIPDNVVDTFKQARGKTQTFAAQACSVAAKVKKMKEQAAQQAAAGGGMQPQRLPAGPL
jgi:hypothetical protein